MIDWQRLSFWLIVLTPFVAVFMAACFGRWKKLPPSKRLKELTIVGVLFAVLLGAYLLWDATRSTESKLAARIYFREPGYLALAIPLYLLVLFMMRHTLAGISNGRMWLSFFLRMSIFSLLLLAVAGLHMVMNNDELSVCYVLDRSKSVSNQEADEALAFMNEAGQTKKPKDQVMLLVFGGKAAEASLPAAANGEELPKNTSQIHAEIPTDQTNIAKALETARNKFQHGTSKRLILFTDGRETAGHAETEIQRLNAEGVDVWVVPLRRNDAPEMLVDDLRVSESSVLAERAFTVFVKVVSNTRAKARIELFLNDRNAPNPAAKVVELQPGTQTIPFDNVRLRTGGPHQIEAVLTPVDRGDDSLAENNRGYAFMEVKTDSRVLIMTGDPKETDDIVNALDREKMALEVRSGSTLPEDPEEFRNYDCIVLANLHRKFLTDRQMAVIESCVHDQGAGLVMIGGDQSFGAGGYLNTPIERALPVDMHLKNERVMPSGALGIVLHTCEFPDGNAWGKKISKAAIDVLSSEDYAGLLYYGGMGGETWLFRPSKIGPNKESMFSQIDTCSPGDMPDLNQIVQMAVQALGNLPRVSVKHCIIITDGDPSPPRAETVNSAIRNKISITICTIYPHGGGDLAQMKEIAERTGGTYYNVQDPKKLPQIFIKEAAIVRKSLIYSDEKGIPVSVYVPGELLADFGKDIPPVRALVMTSLKEGAKPPPELHLATVVEGENVPVFAKWRYGLGKAAAFTSDATPRWAPDWFAWDKKRRFWINLFHWVCRKRIPSNIKVETRLEGTEGVVVVRTLDEQGRPKPFSRLQGTVNEPGAGTGEAGNSFPLKFHLVEGGRYEASFPVTARGMHTLTITDVSDPRNPSSIVTGLANPYSKEFQYLEADEANLRKLADAAGVDKLKELEELRAKAKEAGVFLHNLPLETKQTDLFWQLLLAALCIFPFDVAIRRLRIEPEQALVFVGRILAPVGRFFSRKKAEIAQAAADAAARAEAERAPPPSLMPTGSESREAQSRYEKEGGSQAAKDLNLKPGTELEKPKAVGGTGVSPADDAASDYTRALLKAKRRAKKDQK